MLATLAALLIAMPIQTPPEPLLKYGIVGSTGSNPVPPNQDPLTLLGKPEIQRLLLKVADTPLSQPELEKGLPEGMSAADLLASGLIKRQGEKHVISFNLYTKADVQKMYEVCAKDGKWLADAFLKRRAEIEKLLESYGHSKLSKELAYILVGCFSLDWDGLELSEQMGIRSYNEPHADGGKYVIWAEENGAASLQGMYWGSHNTDYGGVTLTSFGDHQSLPRPGFPDLVGRLGSGWRFEGRPELVTALRRVRRDALSEVGRQVGQVMTAVRDKQLTLEELSRTSGIPSDNLGRLLLALAELHYVEQTPAGYVPLVPVLTAKDREMVMAVRLIGKEIMARWMKERAPLLEKELASITPLRNGVPYETAFNQIWHYVFALANRDLVNAGFLADPYSPDREFKGFIPAVWESSLGAMP